MYNNLYNITKKTIITIIVILSVCIPAFSAELLKAPHEFSEFEDVWDYVIENDVETIEFHYKESPTPELFGEFKYITNLMSEKYRYVHPEDFNYIRFDGCTFECSENSFTMILEFKDLNDSVKREYRTEAYEKAKELYDDMSDELFPEMTQKDRVKVFCEAISERVTYLNDGTDLCHTAYCGLVNGYAVCDGYASILNMLLRLDGIECEGRLGYANGGLHEWTYVKLDGEWLNVDATWFDGDEDSPNAKYAGLTDEEISETHKTDLTYKNLVEKKVLLGPPIAYYPTYTIEPPILEE